MSNHLSLARLLSQDSPVLGIWFGVVDSAPAGEPATMTCFINGSPLGTPNVCYGLGYNAGTAPAVDDVVWGLKSEGQNGPDYIIIDKLAEKYSVLVPPLLTLDRYMFRSAARLDLDHLLPIAPVFTDEHLAEFMAAAQLEFTAANFIALIESAEGTPYLFGGTDPFHGGADCSGLVWWACNQLGYNAPRTTSAEWWGLVHVADPALGGIQPGDLPEFYVPSDGPPVPQHVGVDIGNGTMIDDPYTGAVVRVDTIPYEPGVITPIGYCRLPFANAAPPPPPAPPAPPPTPEDFMPVSRLLSWRTGQTDIIQVNADSLVHKYAQPGDVLRSEVVAGPMGGVVGEAPVQSFPAQTPGVVVEPVGGPGTVSVTVEDVNGHVHLFQQDGTGGPWEHSIFP